MINSLSLQELVIQPEVEILDQKVVEAFNHSFYEVSIGVALTSAACLFATTPYVAASLTLFAVATLAINVFTRFIVIFLEEKGLKTAASIVRKIGPFNNGWLYGTTGNVLIHEGGHAIALSMIYQNAKPQIKISGLFSGATGWSNSRYNCLGKFLGAKISFITIVAAGSLAAIVAATIGIIIALELGNKNSYFSDCIFCSSILSISNHVNYALSAFSASPVNLSHDFMFLWQLGIHPLVSAVFLIAIPLIGVLGYLYNKK